MSEKQNETWQKAAACESHARYAPSDLLRDKFRRLRDSWIRIATAEEIVRSLQPSTSGAVVGHPIRSLPQSDA